MWKKEQWMIRMRVLNNRLRNSVSNKLKFEGRELG